MLQNLKVHVRLAITFAVTALMICMICYRANDLNLIADRVSDRITLMVLPVCISDLYHGRKHNFTAFQELRSIANHYRYTEIGTNYHPGIARMIEPMLSAKIKNPQATMFWGYDDRGLGDYCVLAFSLFGSSIASLSKFWLLLLAISAGSFLMTYVRHSACAYLGLGLYSFLQTPASLSEERVMEYLSYLPALHLALYPFFARSANLTAIVGLVLQTILFVFLYHARSSIGWQVLPILASAIGAFAFKCRKNSAICGNLDVRRAVKTSLLPVVMLIGGMVILSVYTKITYHPAYFGEEGGRTVYHNALMGLHGMSYSDEPRLGIDDNLVKKAVRIFTARQREVSVEEVTYTSQFGATYEKDARDYYFYLLKKDPIGTLSYYIKIKIPKSLVLLWARSILINRDFGTVRIGDTMHRMGEPGVRDYVKSKNLLFSPLVTPISLLTIILAVLFARGSTKGIWPAILIASIFFVAGLIPSTLFYNQDMRQLTGAMLSIGLLLHLVAYWLLAVIWREIGRYTLPLRK